MNSEFEEKFESLLQKYTELLTGKNDKKMVDDVVKWALYSQVAKTMPALAKHWNQMYPDAKQEIKQISLSIKEKNDQLRSQSNKSSGHSL
ncbi:MAG TPA: DUF2573 family protein [Bacillus sp. (in: firmicutes)]|uniref:DUF2573 family protein n=1 Tax=Bacillus litorisediminis TaxID=2922713 RepID=UPI001FABCAA1|nr:DUF2573 family protein [Bacillus litorisediminis]HWO77130.1 DUF2573 family protein [Bacillus sp. (in: firmicutes)]